MKRIARWHDPSSRLAWVVVDTPDAASIQSYMVRWSDYLELTTYTVLDDEEVGAIRQEQLSR